MWKQLVRQAGESGVSHRVLASDILQFLLVDQLCQDRLSAQSGLVRGSALRMVHGAPRYIERIELEHSLNEKELQQWLKRTVLRLQRRLPAYLGTGKLDVRIKREVVRGEGHHLALRFAREGAWEQMQASASMTRVKAASWKPADVDDPWSLLPVPPVVMVPQPDELLIGSLRSLGEERQASGAGVFDLWWLLQKEQIPFPADKAREALSGKPNDPLRRSLKKVLRSLDPARVALEVGRWLPRSQRDELAKEEAWEQMVTTAQANIKEVL